MIDLDKYWWPLATSAELNASQPLARTLHEMPLVLFRRADGEPAILHNRCPHRHAPLSAGRVRQGEVECPYHGWRFDSDGCCTRVPGRASGDEAHKILPAIAVCECHGLIWGCLSLEKSTPEPVGPALVGEMIDTFFLVDNVSCTIPAGAENLLDGFHTHFVHAGWIRRDQKRQTVRAQVRRLADGVEARYSEEGLQSGLISSLLEGDRAESMGRFRLPGVAEIEYRGKQGLNLLLTAWITPETGDRLRIHARVATRQGLMPAWFKKIFLKRLFGIILLQDKTMLEQTHANIKRFEHSGKPAALLDSELDLLGPAIRCLFSGQELEGVEREIEVRL
jgi:phenylpropionate dioxygenase-like ring-hydroxylating dioxygenase large terminal subunit